MHALRACETRQCECIATCPQAHSTACRSHSAVHALRHAKRQCECIVPSPQAHSTASRSHSVVHALKTLRHSKHTKHGTMACDIVANTSEALWPDKAIWPAILSLIRQRHHDMTIALRTGNMACDIVANTSEAQWHDKALWPATLSVIRRRHHGMTMAQYGLRPCC